MCALEGTEAATSLLLRSSVKIADVFFLSVVESLDRALVFALTDTFLLRDGISQ